MAEVQGVATTAKAPTWNTLEVAKLGTQLATPLIVALVGLWLRKALNRIDRGHWSHQKLMEKRMGVFDAMAASLYDVLCYFTLTEHWNELPPQRIVELGRKLKATAEISRPLFTRAFSQAFQALFTACFDETLPHGKVRLKTSCDDRKRPVGFDWQVSWEALFVGPDGSDAATTKIRPAYALLLETFSQQMGVPVEKQGTPVDRER